MTEIESESFKNMYGFSQTPAIIHFKEKKNISYIEWDERNGMPEDLLKTWLEGDYVKSILIKKK